MKKNNIVLKYSKLNIEQLGVCSVKIRHYNKVARCRLFIVPGDGRVLLGMPGMELLGILMIMHDVTEDHQHG